MPKNGFLIAKWLLTRTDLNPLLFKKSNQTIKLKKFLVRNDIVEIASSIKLLEIRIDDQLNFNLHVSNIWKSASKHQVT